MITIPRRQARRLRAVFRRHTLGVAPRGPAPPLVLRADPDAGLRVRFHHAQLAVECVLAGTFRPAEVIALPLEALADLEGRDETPVVLETAAPGMAVARWEDRGVPQTRKYDVADVESLPPFPDPPARFQSCSGGLLDALVAASEIAEDDNTRYALGCLQLRGNTHEVVATDGRQLLIQRPCRFPWDGDVLVRRAPLFACKELPRDGDMAIGKTDSHVVLRAGTWTLWLTIQIEARFPHVDGVLPDGEPAAVLRLDEGDAGFLATALDRLPGGDEPDAPVTLDADSRLVLRARDSGSGRVTEVALTASRHEGRPVRLSTNREYLARALALGFTELAIASAEKPVVCRDAQRIYGWQPLSADSAIGPDEDAIRITPGAGVSVAPADARARSTPPRTAMGKIPDRNGHTTNGARAPQPEPGGRPPGLGALIQEAGALHGALGDAKTCAARLVAALRRQRKQARLMQATLSALKELKLPEVTG